ncbi:hypothetical protein ONS95_007562 [Cadophora gregata]|uniref:uncharacterized protein n=1 Tax=Cadophora gregata TaxID=51156 RepID=UPI0026DD0A7F|nr:uncharacterized protein ONS95_007562 [Cadophora gregata]KAK0125938.1 hypothetical protein ONS95_007562 [Cadophora gregata]
MSSSLGAPPPPGVISNLENPTDVLRTISLLTNGLVLRCSTLVTLGRFYVRFWITGAVFIEDWFCFASWILTAGNCIIGLLSNILGGGGLHAWDISAASMVGYQKFQYAATIIYGPCVWSIKVTLLLILVRVFTPFRRIITAVWSFIFVMLLYYIIVTIVKINVCNPIRAAWDPTVPGKCLNDYLLFSIDTSLSILTDLIVLLLPIPLVWSLKVTAKKKLRTIALLGTGGVATACSIARLVLVLRLDNSPHQLGDQTVSLQRINLLVTAEIGIGIICACLPAFSIFFFTPGGDRSRRGGGRHHPRYIDKSMKLSNLSGFTGGSKSKGTSGTGESRARESYVEIGTPQDLGDLISPPPEAMRRGSWPLRTSGRVESYFEIRALGEV